MADIHAFINNDVWMKFNNLIASEYHPTICIEYSKCSMAKEWNIKYKKKAKNICIVYPFNDSFTVLITISSSNIYDLHNFITSCSTYVKQIYEHTEFFNGSKWMLMEVKDEEIFQDVMLLLKIKTKQ